MSMVFVFAAAFFRVISIFPVEARKGCGNEIRNISFILKIEIWLAVDRTLLGSKKKKTRCLMRFYKMVRAYFVHSVLIFWGIAYEFQNSSGFVVSYLHCGACDGGSGDIQGVFQKFRDLIQHKF